MQVRKITVPFIPRNMAIGANGKVLPDDEINRIKSLIHAEGKYSKKKLNSKFPVVFTRGKYFILCDDSYNIEGGFGMVIPAQNADSGEFVAFKIMYRDITNTEKATTDEKNSIQGHEISSEETLLDFSIKHESEFLSDVGLAIMDEGGHPINFSYVSNKHPERVKYMIAMQWVPGEDINYYDLQRMPFIINLEAIENLLREVRHCHELGILHRDLKGNNFLMDYFSNTVKLIDYGLSRYMDGKSEFHDTSPVGADKYLAPELFKLFDFSTHFGSKKQSQLLKKLKDDLLALENPTRESLREIVSADYVYNEKTEVYALGKLIKKLTPDRNYQYFAPENLQCYIAHYKKMTHINPAQRPTVEACIQFYHDMKNALCEKERTVRIGLVDIKEFNEVRDRSYNYETRTNDRFDFISGLKDFHKIIFFDDSSEASESLYTDVFQDLAGCGISWFSRDVYLTQLNSTFTNSFFNELRSRNPLYHHRLYCVQLDQVIEIKPDQQPSLARLAVKFGKFSAQTQTNSAPVVAAIQSDFDDEESEYSRCVII